MADVTGQLLDVYDAELSEKTVIRVSVKVFDGVQFFDLRLWGRTKDGKLYPKRSGICMRSTFWQVALKLFSDNGLMMPNQSVKDA